MINNFELIKPLFYFNELDSMFFHCQIVRRAKDHKPNKVKEGSLRTFFIRSAEHLERVKAEIILLCEHYKARAYINVSGKDFGLVNKLMLSKLADYNYDNVISVINPKRIINSSAGETKSKEPKWIIDIDDMSLKEPILKWLDERKGNGNPENRCFYVRAEIPTVQGCHLITLPFDTLKFSKDFPNVDVHKNSMGTLLYYPESLSLPKYVCSECGSFNIVKNWVDSNPDNTLGNTCWCCNCQKTTIAKKLV
jgi:hypothetical protein